LGLRRAAREEEEDSGCGMVFVIHRGDRGDTGWGKKIEEVSFLGRATPRATHLLPLQSSSLPPHILTKEAHVILILDISQSHNPDVTVPTEDAFHLKAG